MTNPMKPVFKKEIFAQILPELAKAPDSQIDVHIRERIRNFVNEGDHSDRQTFDFLDEIARTSCCGVSSFVQVLCDVDRFYTRPE